MYYVSSVVLFFLIWWTVIFAILPWGNKRADIIQTGNAGSAPANPRIGKKMLVTTGVAFLLWLPINPLLHRAFDQLRLDAQHMAEEDDLK
jgi:predicted secreted protein